MELIVGLPIGYNSYRQSHIRNLRMVRQDVLYRSGQMSLSGLKTTIRDYGIKTVITFRDAADPKDDPPDIAEERYCKSAGIHYVRISPRVWWAPDGSKPAEEGVKLFREVMDHPEVNCPVLIHCYAGTYQFK